MTFPEERTSIINILQSSSNRPCFVELGAHEGEDSEWILSFIYDKHPRAILVEADRHSFDILQKKNLKAELLHRAIADHDGTCDFYESRGSGGGYGSIYKPIGGLGVDLESFTKKEQIPCCTFDTLYHVKGLDTIDLLYVDIHGAEKDMIRFGQDAIKNTRYLFIECFDTPLYETMATREELLKMLPGWKVLERFPWNMLLKNERITE